MRASAKTTRAGLKGLNRLLHRAWVRELARRRRAGREAAAERRPASGMNSWGDDGQPEG
jgi:hypothetical protein